MLHCCSLYTVVTILLVVCISKKSMLLCLKYLKNVLLYLEIEDFTNFSDLDLDLVSL